MKASNSLVTAALAGVFAAGTIASAAPFVPGDKDKDKCDGKDKCPDKDKKELSATHVTGDKDKDKCDGKDKCPGKDKEKEEEAIL